MIFASPISVDSHIIQVKPQDELTLVIDKIINSHRSRVYLLIPANSRIGEHALNFRLLKREADALGKEIIVVSSSPRIQTLALKSAMQVKLETEDFRERLVKPESDEGKIPVVKDIVPPSLAGRFKVKPEDEQKDFKTQKSIFGFLKFISRREGEHKMDKMSDKKIDTLKRVSVSQTQKAENLPSGSQKPFQGSSFLPKPNIQKLLPLRQRAASIPAKEKQYITEKDLKIKGLVDTKYRVEDPRAVLKKSLALKVFLVLLLTASVAIGAFTFYSILPSAKVYVSPVSTDVKLDIFVKALTNISELNPDEYKIPAQIFEKPIEISKTIASTGEKEINEKATGRIKVYNSFSSEQQTLVKTTRFISEDGKLFRTTETVIVPGAKVEEGKIIPNFAYINVEAAEAGEEYNIGPSTFSIPGFKGTPKYLAFYGKSEDSMSGGKIARVKIVSADDYQKSIDQFKKELNEAASSSLAQVVPEGFIIPGSAYEIGKPEISSSHQVGDETDNFSVTGKIAVKTFAIRKGDVMTLMKKDFEGRFPDAALLEDGDVSYAVKSKYFGDGVLEMNSSLAGKAVAKIDANDVREKIKGKDEVEVRRILSSYTGIEEAKVTFWPFWVSSIPDGTGRIEVIVE